MMLANGTKLGPYEIVPPLGAGGMGEGCLACVRVARVSDPCAFRSFLRTLPG